MTPLLLAIRAPGVIVRQRLTLSLPHDTVKLKTPAGPPSQASTGEQARPPHARTAGAPAMRPNFGAEWAGSGTRCLRFARWVAPPGRKTRFRLLARLFRVGSLSHWVPRKVSSMLL